MVQGRGVVGGVREGLTEVARGGKGGVGESRREKVSVGIGFACQGEGRRGRGSGWDSPATVVQEGGTGRWGVWTPAGRRLP